VTDTPERFVSSKDNGLTPAGSEFMLGYMAGTDPNLAAEALAALREYAASDTNISPEYWVTPR
jgi:hypothetical protein